MRTASINRGKRILSVKLKKIVDDSQPDTSWIGEYSDTRTSEFSIDRAHAEDCASVVPFSEEGQRTLVNARAYIAEEQSKLPDADSREWQDFEDAYSILDGLTETPECDCSVILHREYRYFNPSFNYVDKTGKPTDGLTPEDVRKYVRQDYERMESLNRGSWCFVGVRADAEIAIVENVVSGPARFPITSQTITSGGLWGIESDSDREYLESVQQEELSDLKTQLLALGFSKRAISNAFKFVQEEN
jgi:hypothetical protein